MTKNFIFSVALCASVLAIVSCSKNKSGKSTPNDGQLHGVAPASRWTPTKPIGMVYVPAGTFHMGSSDEDINYTYTATINRYLLADFGWMLLKSQTMSIVCLLIG
jgi:formylglycine-generating enzyme required for sulfatase activity